MFVKVHVIPPFNKKSLRPLKSLPEICHANTDFPDAQSSESRRPKQHRKPKRFSPVPDDEPSIDETIKINAYVLPWCTSPQHADNISIHKLVQQIRNEMTAAWHLHESTPIQPTEDNTRTSAGNTSKFHVNRNALKMNLRTDRNHKSWIYKFEPWES